MEQKKVTVGETEYTLQKIMPREWLRLRDRCKNRYGQPVEENLYTEVLKHIVVNPKVKVDDFKNFAELEELVQTAVRFQQGKEDEEQD